MKSKKTFTVGILGIGGVGGYLGGKLASFYQDDPEVEVCFIAKQQQVPLLQQQGLQLDCAEGPLLARPHKVTADPSSIGHFDLLLVCVKNYDLEKSLDPFKGVLTSASIVLPLENGVNASAVIQQLFPQSQVWQGCIYLVARLISPAHVQQTGSLNRMYFGSRGGSEEQLSFVETLLNRAGIQATHKPNIEAVLWEKFFFISPLATLTSAYDLTVGDILDNEAYLDSLTSLMEELGQVAVLKGIKLPEGLSKKMLANLSQMPPGSSSSMQADFKKQGKTEMYSLAGYIVEMAKESAIRVPMYETLYNKLLEKANSYPHC